MNQHFTKSCNMRHVVEPLAVLLLSLSTSSGFQLLATSLTKRDQEQTLGIKRISAESAIRLLATPPPEGPESLFGRIPGSTVGQPLLVLLFAQFVLFVGVGAVIPVVPIFGKSIGLSQATNGLVLGAPALALLLGAQPSGRYADDGRKPAMLLGMLIIACADTGTAFSFDLSTLVLARLGLGLGRCISESGERGMLADLAGRTPELRGRALAAQQSVAALGIALGAPLGGLVVESYGPRAAFLCVSAAATLCLLLYTALPETVDGAGEAKSSDTESPALWAQLIEDDRWKGLSLCECGARFGFAAKIASVPLLAASAFSGGAAAAGLLLSAAGLSGLVGAPLGGWLADRQGPRFVSVASGIVGGTALVLVPAALALPQQSGPAFAACVLLWGGAAAAQGPANTALAQELAPKGSEAESLALPRASGDATYIVAPFVLGTVADSVGMAVPGAECAVAGGATVAGAVGLALLTQGERSKLAP